MSARKLPWCSFFPGARTTACRRSRTRRADPPENKPAVLLLLGDGVPVGQGGIRLRCGANPFGFSYPKDAARRLRARLPARDGRAGLGAISSADCILDPRHVETRRRPMRSGIALSVLGARPLAINSIE